MTNGSTEDDGDQEDREEKQEEQEVTEDTPLRLVYVEWVDSAAMHGWRSLADIRDDATLAVIQSVGWLLVDTDACKTLVAHMHMAIPQNGDTRFASDPLTIPTVVIRKMIDIALPED